MVNLIKSEFYRVSKGKAFYITLGLIVLYTILSVLTKSTGTVGVSTEETQGAIANVAWSGYGVPTYFIQTLNILQYFFLPMVITVMGTDFNYQTYKNTISKGLSRTKYYLSKLILVLLICIAFSFIYLMVPTIIATILYGFNGAITKEYLMDLFQPYALQMLIMFVIISIASAILFISKKSTACAIGYLIVPIVIQIIVAIIGEASVDLANTIMKYEMISAMSNIAYGILEYNALYYVTVSSAYILITTVLGIYLFNKIDLK